MRGRARCADGGEVEPSRIGVAGIEHEVVEAGDEGAAGDLGPISTGSGPATAPVSTSMVAMAMVAWPQPPRLQNGEKNTTPVTDPGATGGVSSAPNCPEWPRGSSHSMWPSATISCEPRNQAARAAMVAPGIGGKPDVTMRVGMPAVCVSTTRTVRDNLMP